MQLLAHALTCLVLIQYNEKAFMHGNFSFKYYYKLGCHQEELTVVLKIKLGSKGHALVRFFIISTLPAPHWALK